jgi:inhibitor of KinA sporulation pathway (predicted exonuclease)
MHHAIIYDCEYLTSPGAMSRQWCGPLDPDPNVAQIGAVKLSLQDGHDILDTFKVLIKPRDRFGAQPTVDPFFTELTGITQADIDREGVAHSDALARFAAFSDGATFWSWGKDELTLLAISSYVEGVIPPIPAHRFGNAIGLVLNAGTPVADMSRMTSGRLSEYFGFSTPDGRQHDALDDAMSVAVSLQHLLRTQKLSADDFTLPLTVRPPELQAHRSG